MAQPRRDRAPFTVAVVLGAAIAYGAFNGSQWVQFQNGAISEARAEEAERFGRIRADIGKIDSGEKAVSPFADPRSPQSFGRSLGTRYAVMPPSPLGSLAIGQSDFYPHCFRVSTGNKDTFVNNDEIENPVHLLAGRFDLAFVFLYLYPLVILAFSYNIVSTEKESGTLALTLSQPVSLGRIVMAKVLLRALFVLALSVALWFRHQRDDAGGRLVVVRDRGAFGAQCGAEGGVSGTLAGRIDPGHSCRGG